MALGSLLVLIACERKVDPLEEDLRLLQRATSRSGAEITSVVQQQPADTLSLRVEVISNGSSLRLRATFIARAW
jgi:hypothetical protein